MNRSPTRRLRTAWALSVWALATGSCSSRTGPALNPVTGSAVFEGRPAAGAVLTFHRVGDPDKQNLPHAVVAADGSFIVTTFVRGDGAAAGRYAITVIWRKKGQGHGDDDGGKFVLPLRYLSPETSGLTVEVKEGPNQLVPLVFTK